MLHDPRKDIETKASLVAWLAQQDPNGRYVYTRCGSCMLVQYFVAHGIDAFVDASHYRIGAGLGEEWHPLPSGWNEIAREHPWTFGGALARALA